jgi:hypothetical protein
VIVAAVIAVARVVAPMVVPSMVATVDPMVVMHQNKTIATAAIALDSSLLIHSFLSSKPRV